MKQDDLNITIGESARLGQAINLASEIYLTAQNNAEHVDHAKYREAVRKNVFEVTLPMITQIRTEYIERRDNMLESSNVDMHDLADKQYDEQRDDGKLKKKQDFFNI